ncbi:fimbrin-like protein [Phytophthora cinnamomi]|uniref:fimbrin-like protein n=1 Tax=Phytophthora cinnamomi TaxID=4785 RepID=UPI00355A72C5|nr:fimbrin-like protein [Phytophthora cinnamomi]
MSYQVSSVFLQKFSPKEIHELKRVFKEHDRDYAAAVPVGELHTVLLKLGENVTPNQATVMLQQTRLARPEQITFQEFLELLHDFRNGAIALDPALLMGHASVAPAPVEISASTPVAAPVAAPAPPEAQPTPTPFFPGQKTASWQTQSPEPAQQAPAFAQKAQWPPAGTPTAPTAAPAPAASKPQWPPTANQAASWGHTPSSAPQAPAPAPVATHAKPQWPPAGSSESTTAKPQWPPAASSTPAAPAAAPAPPARRASAAAQYNSTIHEVKGTAGGLHSYSEEETAAFTEHINNTLHADKDVAGLMPIGMDAGLFRAVCDGVLLCKLINAAVPETIDERALNFVKRAKELNVYQKTENQNLCINAAKSIGCSVVNIGPDDLIEGKPILVLGLVWQIIKIQLTSTINLKNHPELMRLLLDGETLEEFMKLPPDQILLRWMNYHLKAAGHPKKVTNFSTDVQDATAYSVLLHHIAPQHCDLCNETVPEERAAHVIQNARRLEVETFIKPRDITSGNPKLNMSFVAQLFNTCPALDVVEEEIKQLEEILYDDVGDTREERVFRMWINSLAIDDVYINHLYSDLSDGMKLLKVLDKIQKGIVAWNKVNMVAPNKFKQVENCNYCVVLGKQLKFSLVNVGGADIFEGAKKMILSIVWQSMRYQQLRILSELAAGRGEITDKDIIGWANEKVRLAGRAKGNIVAFRDPSLSDGLYLLDLVHAVEPRAVNWDMVLQDKTDDAKASNAKYAISCAQKIGATVFLTYEDIVEVKPKMMMTFVASLMLVDHQRA